MHVIVVMRVCVVVCVCGCVCRWLCVCVCVCEREKERKKGDEEYIDIAVSGTVQSDVVVGEDGSLPHVAINRISTRWGVK